MLLLALLACSAPPEPASDLTLPTAAPEVLRLVAVGDVGHENATRRHVAEAIGRVCAERGCDAGLLLGDNLYDRGLTAPDDERLLQVLAPFRTDGLPWLVVHGNHDYGHVLSTERAGWARDQLAATDDLHHPSPWYTVHAGPVDLFALDTTWAFWRGAQPQQDWLLDQLDHSRARWRLVFGHHTFRSEGEHGNAGAYEGWVNLPFASGEAVERLFERTLCDRADLYVSGHDHTLQLLEHCGVPLVVSGSGSAATPLVGHGNRPYFARSAHGFTWIELGERARVLFFDEAGALLHESGAIDPRSVLY